MVGTHSEVNDMRTATILLGLALISLTAYWLYLFLQPSPDQLPAVYLWLREISIMLGYPGAFLMSFFGNATVLIPFPYVGLPYILGGLVDEATDRFMFDPFIIGLVSGIGATLGEMTGYLIGRLGGEIADTHSTSTFRRVINSHPRLTPLALFILAATPIPDDILVVPLGVARYPFWHVFIPQLLGKTLFLTAVALAGRLSLSWIEGLILTTDTPGLVAHTIEVFGLAIVIVIVYLMLTRESS